MSETALTLINSAMRTVGVLAVGETLSADHAAIGLENMKFMFRHWSAKNIRLYFTTQESFAVTGASPYTWGTGGTFNSARPTSIRGAYIQDSYEFSIVDEKTFRINSGSGHFLWYSPEYPLAKVHLNPDISGTIYINSLKPLTDPSALTSTVAFPPEYDEAIKYGLAVRLAAEYGRPITPEVAGLAQASMNDLEIKNFAEKINAARLDLISIANRYNINEE